MTAQATSFWLKNRWLWVVIIGLITLTLLTVLAAPNTSQRNGSSFSRTPDGYGAWFTQLQQQGVRIQRWQRPTSDLEAHAPSGNPPSPMTLVRVINGMSLADWVSFEDDGNVQTWVQQGNRLIILGSAATVTRSPFRTLQQTPSGTVTIETSRRKTKLAQTTQTILGDRFGAIVWKQTSGKGEVIYASTPYLGANAYQDAPGNYPFLTQLVTAEQHSVLVDEYIHGYKEADVIAEEVGQTWQDYLAQTPLLPILLQGIILLLLVIWAHNQRFGLAVTLPTPQVNNSRAYMDALAEVLQKAKSHDFIVDVVGKEEQRWLQQALGLGQTPLEPDQLVTAWVQQTGRSPHELEQVLRPYWQKRRFTEADLTAWIVRVQQLHQSLPHVPTPRF